MEQLPQINAALAGLIATVISMIVAIVKELAPTIQGRWTQLMVFILSIIGAVAFFRDSTVTSLVALVTIFPLAMGARELIHEQLFK